MFKVTLANWTRWIVFARSVHYAVPLFAPKETNVRCVNVFRRRGLLRYLYPLLAPARTFRRQRGGGEGGRERDGIVVARQPFRRYRAVDNEDSCSWKFARVVWPSCVLSKYRKSRFHVSSIVEPSSLIGQLVSN